MESTNIYNILTDELDYNCNGNKIVSDVSLEHVEFSNNKSNNMKLTRKKQRRHRRGGKSGKNKKVNCSRIKIAFNNVNRLRPKIHEVDKLLKDEHFDVFGIAESFLNGTEALNVVGYSWVGKNRLKNGGGGIGLYISDLACIVDNNVFNSTSDDFERLWVKVSFGKDKPMYIAVAYFPVEGTDPDATDELYGQLLSEVLRIEDLEDDPCVLIMGDMNGRIGREISYGDPVLNSNGERLLNFRDDANIRGYCTPG